MAYAAFYPENTSANLFVESIYNNFSMVPADILQGKNLFTLLTCMFLHADIFHIAGNMIFFYIFGDNVEDAFGHWKYLVFYLVAGLVANLIYIMVTALSAPADLTVPLIGASGAISGVLGAYGMLYPWSRIRTWVVIRIISVPAIIFLGSWFLLQLVYMVLDMSGGVAYWAHIGGFLFGAVVAVVYLKLGKASD